VPKNEDGEFELILANRQLLSVFFIVVVLLGVFFTMGYIVGRNAGPTVDVASARKPESKPMVVDSQPPPETAAPVSAPPAAAPAPTSTQPQQPTEVAKVEPKSVEVPAKKEPPAKKEKEKPVPVSAQPVSGQTYLQLAATAKPEADVLVDVLHHKQFKAIAVEAPDKPGLYRVLVGPIADGALNKMKSDLTSAGFPGDKAFKKVY
jgi:cytoskeletal protein RodZ